MHSLEVFFVRINYSRWFCCFVRKIIIIEPTERKWPLQRYGVSILYLHLDYFHFHPQYHIHTQTLTYWWIVKGFSLPFRSFEVSFVRDDVIILVLWSPNKFQIIRSLCWKINQKQQRSVSWNLLFPLGLTLSLLLYWIFVLPIFLSLPLYVSLCLSLHFFLSFALFWLSISRVVGLDREKQIVCTIKCSIWATS